MNSTDRVYDIDGVKHYLAPAKEPTGAGLLLIPFVYGMSPHMKWMADSYAASGMTTLMWNPYPDLPWGTPLTVGTRPARPKDEQSIVDLSRCIDRMEQDLGLTSIGTIGYCMGGRSLLLFGGSETRIKAHVAVYPSIRGQLQKDEDLDPFAAAARVQGPVQLICAGNDPVTPRPIFDTLIAVLHNRRGARDETSVLFYPQAGHGFMHIPSELNDAATRSALPQIQNFLDIHLKGVAGGSPLALPPVRGDYEVAKPSEAPILSR
jgi:carboxymethylenebutenolidase